ncbi:MAG: nitroreductase family protein [Candidatus Binatus sp.]
MQEMGIYETMRTLRAVRRLRPDAIPDDVLHRVLEAATWAPTGGNVQPWRIVVVKDRALKEPLGQTLQRAMDCVLEAIPRRDSRKRVAGSARPS